jgi:hypothetical protein
MCDGAGHRPDITYYTTNVPGGRVSLIALMLFLLYVTCAFFVDLIDTTASTRDPSCFPFYFTLLFFVLPCFALSCSSKPGRSAHLSRPFLTSFLSSYY